MIGLIVARSGGISIPSGSLVLPNEVIIFRVTNLDNFTIGARFVVKDQYGNTVFDQTAGRELFRDSAYLDVSFLAGSFSIQGFEMWPWGEGEASNIFTLVVSSSASNPPEPNPPEPRDDLGSGIVKVLKATAVTAGVIVVGYLVMKTGAVDLAASKIKSRIRK